MKFLPLIFLIGCSAGGVAPHPAPVRDLNVRIVSELSDAKTKAITETALDYLRRIGVMVRDRDDCAGIADCVHIGVKSKQVWRYLVGFQGWYSADARTILVYAGFSDTYAAKILAHELGHALGCPHEMRGLMHNPMISSPIMWPFDGIDLATDYSEACKKIIRGEK